MNSEELINLPPWWVSLSWIVYLAFCTWLLVRCIGIRRFNTFSILIPLLLVTNGLLVPFSRNINAVLSKIQIDDVSFRNYWIGLALLYIFLPFGVMLTNSLIKRPIQAGICLRRAQAPVGTLIFLLALFVLCLFYIVKIYQDGIGVDLVRLFRGYSDYNEYAGHRYSFSAATSSWDYFLYNKIPYAIAPMAVIVAWNWSGLGRTLKWLFLSTIVLCLTQTGHKLPIVFVATLACVSSYAIRHQMRVSSRFFVLLGVLGGGIVFLVLPVLYLMQGASNYTDALWWSIERIAGESYRALQLHFYVYPQYHSHLWGTSQQTVAAVVGVKNFIPVSVYIPTEFLGLKNTSYPALFIGEAWADFGFAGVVVYAISCGAILQAYNRWYYGLRIRLLEDTALFVTVCIATIHLMHCNFITAFSTYGLGTSLVIYLLIRWTSGRLARLRSGPANRTIGSLRSP